MRVTVRIEGLPRWVSAAQLKDWCSQHGHVVTSALVQDGGRRGPVVGLVEMRHNESFEPMLAQLRQARGFERSLKVSIERVPDLKKAAFVSAALLLIV